jgi:hypothetical protein
MEVHIMSFKYLERQTYSELHDDWLRISEWARQVLNYQVMLAIIHVLVPKWEHSGDKSLLE